MSIEQSILHGDRPTIIQRLEYRALRGVTWANLRLYQSQEKQLLKDGFSIQRTSSESITGYPGQHSCRISWRHVAIESSKAHELLMVSADNNPKLKEQLLSPSEDNPVKHLWFFQRCYYMFNCFVLALILIL